ncbi:multifunctional oxoglutarate decarboxylase/oxoglutarate dehydrogenase thiamine pyrophosphate-binding subunit/dihydrolipoyllysine-residue succinyltransferase subunit [Dermabacteraceae bacterium P7074]
MSEHPPSIPREFGPNQWLVEQLYKQYLSDPASVEPSWVNYFRQAALAPQGKPAVREPIPAQEVKLRGPAAAVVKNMTASLDIPTATSVRDIPVKLLFDNRIMINTHLARHRRGKVSFTHLIAYAMVEALQEVPDLNNGFSVSEDGKPLLLQRKEINFGLAIDMPKPDGTRGLVVPNIRGAQEMDFVTFWQAYDEVVRRARQGKLTMSDFADTTVTLTNPGGIGTVHSVPRLMPGQGVIVGVGAIEYPAAFQGASQETLSELAVSKKTTLTSTYDHRVIQGAASGEFLRCIGNKLLGLDGFYDRIFHALRIPYQPIRWVQDNPLKKSDTERYAQVMDLIHAYRVRGHLMADTDPLQYRQRTHRDLDVETYGLTLWDLDRTFATRGLGGKETASLREILLLLQDAYCRSIGAEYMHIADADERLWLQQQFEKPAESFSKRETRHIMDRLNAAEAFETFLQTKFVGQKRFSLEGGESLIPLLDAVLDRASHDDVHEVCIGMAHRGRLNVLANLAGKNYAQIFREFDDGASSNVVGSGDVKYHLGTTGVYTAPDGATTKIHLAANPSHLEAVNPVLEGIVRAKQDRLNHAGTDFPVLPILLHGDAAFAGQGVVTETLNLSELRGFRTGGTIHVVINNQIGFTTLPDSSRSSYYATDVAKASQLPIMHVNSDDPEACVRAARIAFDYRQKFGRDVIIDMVCYRRRGHNEGDDPSMTQPQMYRLIEQKPSVRKLYAQQIVTRGDFTEADMREMTDGFQQHLEEVLQKSRTPHYAPPVQQSEPEVVSAPVTATDTATLERIGDAHLSMPEAFNTHPKLHALMRRRRDMSRNGDVDWAFAELLAFGSLLCEGTPVRLSGQDSRRGTFAQRHSVLIDSLTQDTWTPLLHLGCKQAKFWVYDSSLSEYAVLGYEYGYSVETRDALVLWEAQFGDFVNGAQTVIDEFIASSEQKWGQHSGVVLLLPHGYDGQGPDHSSARPERFLQLCAQNNMRVAMPSSPANYFHLLRDQAKRRPRRPLIVFTPKSMLRMKSATSPLREFTEGAFRPVIADPTAPADASLVLLCSGRLAHDLRAQRNALGRKDVAIVCVEQFYPFPAAELAQELSRYPQARVRWVQEEPENQGACTFLLTQAVRELGMAWESVARPASASPATGSVTVHRREQEELLRRAFA